jgi:hypothetical protein
VIADYDKRTFEYPACTAPSQPRPSVCSFQSERRCAEILTKALVRVENNIFAILSFKSSDDKMPARDRFEVVDKCIVDGSSQ